MPTAVRVVDRIQDQSDYASALSWAGLQTFASGARVNAVAAIAVGSGAGNALVLSGGDAASGNTDGGDLVVRPGAKSGAGNDGAAVFRAVTGSPGDGLVKIQDVNGNTQVRFDADGAIWNVAGNHQMRAAGGVDFYPGNVLTFRVQTGQVALQDGKNIAFDMTTGSQIGTAVGQKFAFHGSAPVAQRSGATQAAVATTGATNTAPYGYTTAAQADAIVTLLNEIRAALVEKGIIKGSA